VRQRRGWRHGFFIATDVGKANVDGWADEARRAMPLGVERRLVEFGCIRLGVYIDLQWIGEVTLYFALRKR
jgi:hypothetical protein